MGKSKYQKIFLTLASIVMGWGIALFGFEFYLRTVGFLSAQPAPYPCVVGDPVLNHVFQPNCEAMAKASDLKTDEDVKYKTNSIGMRSKEIIPNKPTLLLLGDSYTEGFGVPNDSTLSSQLEIKLRKRNINIQVANGGIVGYSPAIQELAFRKKYKNLKPKYVLYNLDFTDVHDDVYFYSIAEYGEDGYAKGFPGRELLPRFMLEYIYGNYSALLRLVHQDLNQWFLWTLKQEQIPKMMKIIQSAPRLIDLNVLNEAGLGGCANGFEFTAKLLFKLKKEVEKAGGKFMLHMYPSGYMIKNYDSLPQGISIWRKISKNWSQDFNSGCSFDLRAIPVFQKLAQDFKIPFFSTEAIVKNYKNHDELYFDGDAHWTIKGIDVVSENLIEQLSPVL